MSYDPYQQQPPQQPHTGYDGYDPYGTQPPQDATQTWQGETWDTSYQPVVTAEPAGHVPPQAYGAPIPPVVEVPVTAPPEAAAPLTAAQRARAEGRSPIIPPGPKPAVITAVLAGLLALTAPIGPYALLVPVVLLQAVTAAGWFRLNGMWPARQGIVLAFAGGLVADAMVLALDPTDAPGAIVGTLGAWVVLTLVLQLRSRAGAEDRLDGLTATIASSALAIIGAGFLAAAPEAVPLAAAGVAAAVLARALPLPGAVSLVVAVLAAAGAGIAVDGAAGALAGLCAGLCALVGLRVASYDYPSRFVHMTAGVALPLALAAPAVYVIGRLVG